MICKNGYDCPKGPHGACCGEPNRYPYTHHGPAVHGSKVVDYLISEYHLREDHPELFAGEE